MKLTRLKWRLERYPSFVGDRTISIHLGRYVAGLLVESIAYGSVRGGDGDMDKAIREKKIQLLADAIRGRMTDERLEKLVARHNCDLTPVEINRATRMAHGEELNDNPFEPKEPTDI